MSDKRPTSPRDALSPSDEAYVHEINGVTRVGSEIYTSVEYAVCIDDEHNDGSTSVVTLYRTTEEIVACLIAHDWNAAGTTGNDHDAWMMINVMMGRFE